MMYEGLCHTHTDFLGLESLFSRTFYEYSLAFINLTYGISLEIVIAYNLLDIPHANYYSRLNEIAGCA